MNLLAQIPIIGNPAVTIIAFVFLIGVVIFVHEYGHYIVGRWCGIHAETFSLGFGPVILKRTDRRGTVWQLAAIPLGGYVKFLGDRNAASAADTEMVEAMNEYDRRRSFPAASVWRRALTVLAGPVFNFLLSIAIFTGLIMWQGYAIEQPTFGKIADLPMEIEAREGDRIMALNGIEVNNFSDLYQGVALTGENREMDVVVLRDGAQLRLTLPDFRSPYISSVIPLSRADKAGVLPGDIILKIDDISPSSFGDLVTYVLTQGESEMIFSLWRSGEIVELAITPEIVDVLNEDGTAAQIPRIGVGGGDYFRAATETPPIWLALKGGTLRTYDTVAQSFRVIKLIFTGAISPKSLQGPVGIAQISGAVIKQSMVTFISLIAIISTSIGMLNLFPIPILDGGHLVTYIYEALRGKPPSPGFLNVFMSIGLALVLFLMVFTLYNDIMRL